LAVVDCNYSTKEEFDPTTEEELKIVKINCERCTSISRAQKRNYLNPTCFKNILKIIKSNLDVSEVVLHQLQGKGKLTKDQISYLTDYALQSRLDLQ